MSTTSTLNVHNTGINWCQNLQGTISSLTHTAKQPRSPMLSVWFILSKGDQLQEQQPLREMLALL